MKKDITDFNVRNQKVIVRCDLNVPIKDGVITDDTRIRACIETIGHLIGAKAKVIILSHLGRVKEEKDKEKNSLRPVATRLSELISRPVKFIPYTRGVEVEDAINSMEAGDVVMLENTRFEDLDGNKESGNDKELAHYWASLGDIFINDAFGTIHRSHASNVGIASILPSGIGFLVKNEEEKINDVLNNPSRPFVVLLGGAKVSDKIGVIENLVKKADYILIGGGMPYTFYKALGYNVGLSIVDDESLDFCRNIYKEYSNKIGLPEDIVVASSLSESANTRITTYKNINNNEIGIDIGISTINRYRTILMNANTIIWNGPMGMFEISKFSQGTKKMVEILSNSKAKIVIGGGDTISALNKFRFNNNKAHISTGGGASLEMLEGKELPGLKVISDK